MTHIFSIFHCIEESFLSLVKSCGFVGCNWLAFLSLYFYSVVTSVALCVLVNAYVALDVVSLVGQHDISLSLCPKLRLMYALSCDGFLSV